MAPTSGEQPYTLSATFFGPSLIDGLNYELKLVFSTQTGSCPILGTAVELSQNALNTLLSSGSFTTINSVSVGGCRTYTLSILRVSDGAVIDSANAYVDNT